MRQRKLIGAESGFLLVAGATLILTALIGGAAILSVIATRQPLSQASERLDNNTATPQDMQAIQGANQDFVRSAQIAVAAGNLVGSAGPIPDISGGPKHIVAKGAEEAGILTNKIIGKLTVKASKPPLTRDNPSGGTPSQAGRSPAAPVGSGVGSPRPPVDFGAIDRLGQQSHEGRYGGKPSPTSGAFGGPEGTPPTVIDPNYATPPVAPPPPGTDQPPPVAPGLPPPDAGQEPYPPTQPGAGAGTGAGDCPPGQHREQPGGPCH
jgi:hypothetical protein